jgi:acetyl-CoA carboxylase beta subunit
MIVTRPTTRASGACSPSRRRAPAFLDAVADSGSWRSWDARPAEPDLGPGYRAELKAARRRSGTDEAVLTGAATIRGRPVAIAAGEFSFMAGSVGLAAAARLVSAIERATRERLPFLAAPVSGGTRIQEGPLAFVQMANISRAVVEHRSAGVPYLVFLRDPTVGGVFASWGSLGHVTVAEPGALIAFTGPRVYQATRGRPFPPGVQVAENLLRHGLIDAVAAPGELPGLIARVLDVLAPPPASSPQPGSPGTGPAGRPDGAGPAAQPSAVPPASPGVPPASPGVPPAEQPGLAPAERPAWEVVARSRDPRRPGVRALLEHGGRSVTALGGTGDIRNGANAAVALVRFGAVRTVLVGHDRVAERSGRPVGPAALRMARRGIRLAAELRLPLVTVIDTAGAELSREAEEQGLAGQIARCLAALVTLASPTVSVLLGQGAGGGALALLPADRVIAAENSWLAALAPEGASVIRHRTSARAAEMAEALGITAPGLLRDGIVDKIIAEPADVAADQAPFMRTLAAAIEEELHGLLAQDRAERLARRAGRFQVLPGWPAP